MLSNEHSSISFQEVIQLQDCLRNPLGGEDNPPMYSSVNIKKRNRDTYRAYQ